MDIRGAGPLVEPVEMRNDTGNMTHEVEVDEIRFFGDEIKEKNGNLRIMYNNVNGLKINEFMKSKLFEEYERKKKKILTNVKKVDKVCGVLATLRKWDANIVSLSETQVAWENYNVRNKVSAELRKIDRYANMIGSSSCAACGDFYKPGGTLTIVDGNWSGRATTGVDSQKLGRWSYITITGRNSSLLTVVTAYRCCKNQTMSTAGITTSFMQQEKILKQRKRTGTPQMCFIQDLEKFVEKKIAEGHDILVNMDANEQWEDVNSTIRVMALKLGLFDIAKERNPDGVPPTYVRSNSERRIDLLLGTEKVLQATMAYGMILNENMILGDHRPQYVDINIKALLQLNAIDIGSPASRRLRSTDIKSVKVYCEKVDKHFKTHDVFSRVEKLWEETSNQVIMTRSQIMRYEAIDRDVFRLCINAEKTLKLFKYTKYLWSPALDTAGIEVKHWKCRRQYLQDASKTAELVNRSNELGIDDKVDSTLGEINTALANAYKSLHKIQKKDCEKRQEFLSDLAEKYAKDNKMTKEQAIRELINHEELREMHRTIRLRMGGSKSPQLSEVWINTVDGNKEILSNSEDIESHLLERNWSQLRQAANTPFADGEWGDTIRWDGTGDMANRMVEGEILLEIQHKKKIIQQYIEGMAVSDRSILDTLDTKISLKQYREFWKKKRETTATSPFGLHIGHFKSVLDIEHKDILEVHHRLMMMPFRHAMIPARWAQTVQVLLEKDSGRPFTHRLRIIELFDSQVNAGLQILFGKRMIDNAMKHDQIHPSAYGSVPERTAQDAVMEKTLSMDILRVTKKTGAIFDCDAKGCYDRIVASLQTVASRRLGVPRSLAIFFARFWRVCSHHVKTRFGVSSETYTSTRKETLYGIGQGNGAGPAFWLTTLIIMFNVLDKVCKGIRFRSPDGNTTHKSTGLGYVDDVTLGATAGDEQEVTNDEVRETAMEEEEKVHAAITITGQHWETMLHINGGLLELKKCFWVFIAWKWPKGVGTMKTANEILWELNIRQSEDNTEVKIPMKDVKDAPRVLGCHVAADGKWDREFGKWKTEAMMFAKKVKNARFSRTCGGRVYPSIWMAKLRYIASVVCFTKIQSDTINRRVVTQCLPAAGFNRNYPRRVVHGPRLYGGMGWESCLSVQIVEKVKFIIKHMRKMDKIGGLLQILIEVVQLQSGLNEPILVTQTKWQRWVEPTWLTHLKDGLDLIEGALHTNCKAPKKQRQFDRSIMTIFAEWDMSDKEIQAINRCRIYLQVIFLSDITNIHGTKLEQDAVDVQQGRRSTYRWARQVRPIKADRNIWKKYILRLCYNDTLITPLGEWSEVSHQIWPAMVSQDGHRLLKGIAGVQKIFNSIGGNRYEKVGVVSCDTENGFPTEYVVTPTSLKIKNDTRSGTEVCLRSREIFYNADKATHRTMGHIQCADMDMLRERWLTGDEWYMGTDGGLKSGLGSCGVTLYNKTEKKEVCCSISAESCGHGQLHSTREELRAVLVAEYIIRGCNMHFGKVEQKIEYICDNKSAIKKIIYKKDNTQQEVDPLAPEAELLMEITHTRKDNDNILRTFRWVKSHQNNNEGQELSEYAKMNERADDLATEARMEAKDGFLPVQPKQIYNKANITLTIKGLVVSKDIKGLVSIALYGEDIRKYLKEKYDWDEVTFQKIDWDAHEHELSVIQGLHKISVYKLIHRWQPTNKVVQRNERRSKDTAKCTECGEIDDQLHYMKCQSSYFVEARKYAWKKFRNALKNYKLNSSMIAVMWVGVQRWVYNELDDEENNDLPLGDDITQEQCALLTQAFEEQKEIGWEHFIVGRIAKGWGIYYMNKIQDDEEQEGKVMRFTRNLVKATWTFTLSVWGSHNEAVHGKDNKYSSRDVRSIQKYINEIFSNLRNFVSLEDQWLFREEARIRCDRTVPQMIGWLERVLLSLEEIPEADSIVRGAKRLLLRMSVSSIFD